jgi:hypothetical protein
MISPPLFFLCSGVSSADPVASAACFCINFQVEASTNQVAQQQGAPLYNLPWKIPCKVMNVELKVVAALHYNPLLRSLL